MAAGRVAAAGLAPDQITVEIVESSLVEDSLEVAAACAPARRGYSHRHRRFRDRLFEPGLSRLAAARCHQDRSGDDRRYRRRKPRPDHRQGDDQPRPRACQVIEGARISPSCLLEEWGCDLYQGFLGAAPLDQALARRRRRRAAGPPKPAPAPSFRPPPAPASARARSAARRSAVLRLSASRG